MFPSFFSSSSSSSSSSFLLSPAVLPLQKQRPPPPPPAAAAIVPPPPNDAPIGNIHNTSQVQQQQYFSECICERPMALVICRRCGHDLMGRVLSPCQAHPRRIALMDLRECPREECRSVHLMEVIAADE